VFINYQLPTGWAIYRVGRLFGRFYAKWCVDQMLKEVTRTFPPGRGGIGSLT
jgi:hypothetical protein